jgi:hypothetical protein
MNDELLTVPEVMERLRSDAQRSTTSSARIASSPSPSAGLAAFPHRHCATSSPTRLRRPPDGTAQAKLAEWLPYWLDNVIKPRRKLSTYDKYEAHVRLYLVPMLGTKRLESLGVADVRRFLVQLEKKTTAATAKESHRVLRTALSTACREELISRNVASLVEPPRGKARDLSPWTLDETLDFLAAARKDPLYAAFVLAIAMGLRRGRDRRPALGRCRPGQACGLRAPADSASTRRPVRR